MGEIQNQSFQLSFNASLKVDFQGSRITSDGGPAERDRGSCGGAVPASGVHRDQFDPAEPGCGALLKQARYGGAVDQGGEAGRENDAAELPSLSVERGAAVAERDRLQPGESREAGRRRVLPGRIDGWSLTSSQHRLAKTGGRLIKHARYYWLLRAESHLTRRPFGGMVRRIASLPLPAE
jgi:hypothetical protein